MIQRKQTIYLFIALVLNIVCLFLPVGRYVYSGMEPDAVVTNLWIQLGDGSRLFSGWFLFFILLVGSSETILAISSYKKRSVQAMLCLSCMVLMVLWYGGFCLLKFHVIGNVEAELEPSWAFCLPFVSLVFYILARRGVLADEKLVRSMDRIR